VAFLWGRGILGAKLNFCKSVCLKLKLFDIAVEIWFIKFGNPNNIFPVSEKLVS
jgi:hypothetical protein